MKIRPALSWFSILYMIYRANAYHKLPVHVSDFEISYSASFTLIKKSTIGHFCSFYTRYRCLWKSALSTVFDGTGWTPAKGYAISRSVMHQKRIHKAIIIDEKCILINLKLFKTEIKC